MKRCFALLVCLFACSSERWIDPGPAVEAPSLIDKYLAALRYRESRAAQCKLDVTGEDWRLLRFLWWLPPVPAGLEEALRSGDAVLDPQKVDECIGGLTWTPPCWGPDSRGFLEVPACDAAVSGRKADGAACHSGGECAGGLCSTNTCPGVCIRGGREGDPCGTDAACVTGLTCTMDGCMRLPPPCQADDDCGSDRVCFGGACVAPGPAEGSECELYEPCGRGLYCRADDVPFPETGICTRRQDTGGECSYFHQPLEIDLRPCVGHQQCLGITVNFNSRQTVHAGRCGTPGNVGDPCEVDNDYRDMSAWTYGDCLLDLRCDLDSHTCQRQPSAGEPAHRGWCDAQDMPDADGICRPRPLTGEACTGAVDCVGDETFCDEGVCKDFSGTICRP